jgi:DNA primase
MKYRLRPGPPEYLIYKIREKQFCCLLSLPHGYQDSFRVYVNDKNDVRFHCFGACNTEWDVYNLIMLRKRCGFKQAQIEPAKVLGVDEFEMFQGKSDSIPDKEEEPDEPLDLSEPEELTPEMREVLDRAAQFYRVLLISDEKQSAAIRNYLDT